METQEKLQLPHLTADNAPEGAKEILEQTQQAMGMVPNLYGYLANNPSALQTYATGYQLFREQSGFSSVEQEVILLSISRENECDYCMSAHSFVADQVSGVPAEVTDAIRDDHEIPDEKLKVLSEFTRKLVRNRGWVDAEDIGKFVEAGFSEKQVPEIITAIGVKTISNYFNHINQTPKDDVFGDRKWEAPK